MSKILWMILLIFTFVGISLSLPSYGTNTDLKKQCEQKGGQWLGTTEGLGRLSGCNMPTKDGGKKCTKGEYCESGVCLQSGTCHGWQKFKGCAHVKGHDGILCVD